MLAGTIAACLLLVAAALGATVDNSTGDSAWTIVPTTENPKTTEHVRSTVLTTEHPQTPILSTPLLRTPVLSTEVLLSTVLTTKHLPLLATAAITQNESGVEASTKPPVSREELEEVETRSPKDDVEVLPITSSVGAPTTTTTTTTTAEPTSVVTSTLAPKATTLSATTEATTLDGSSATSHQSTEPPAISKSTPDPSDPSLLPRPIVPKCCPLGERVLVEKKRCYPSPLEFIPPFLVEYEFEYDDEDGDGEESEGASALTEDLDYDVHRTFTETTAHGYDIIVGNPCKYGRYRLEPRQDSRDEFYLLPNGSLVAPFLFGDPLGPDEFCMDVFPDTSSGDAVVLPLVCFTPPQGPRRSDLQFVLYPIGLLLSVPFLLVTLLVYAMTPALRDVHGKSLMCHVCCLVVAYIALASVQLWSSSLSQEVCAGIAYLIQFSFVACFFWLNVMCINTWWNMAYRADEKWCRSQERRRFVLYSMYAWALPCVLISVSLVMDFTPTIPSSYLKPRFGVDACWFQSDSAALPYFYGPVSVLLLINVVLFVLTARSVCRQRRARNALEARALTTNTCFRRHNRAAFKSCLFLFCAMGVNWVMEMLSWFIGGPDYIWYVTDTLNTLQGIIIFAVFVLNTPVRLEVRSRLRALRQPKVDHIRELPQIDDFQTVVKRGSRVFRPLPVPN